MCFNSQELNEKTKDRHTPIIYMESVMVGSVVDYSSRIA